MELPLYDCELLWLHHMGVDKSTATKKQRSIVVSVVARFEVPEVSELSSSSPTSLFLRPVYKIDSLKDEYKEVKETSVKIVRKIEHCGIWH